MAQAQYDLEIAIFSDVIAGLFMLVVSLISLRLLFKKRSKILAFFFLSWMMFAAYLVIGSICLILESPMLFKINDSMIFSSSLIFWLAFLDYAQHDTLSAKKIMLSTFFFAFVVGWSWYPSNEIVYTVEYGFVIPFYDIYMTMQNIYVLVLVLSMAYWQILTALKSPPSMKKLTRWLYFGGIFSVIAGVTALMESEFFFIMFLSIVATALISSISIWKEPRIIHLLPFKVYRLVITSKNGVVYYERSWEKIELESAMVAGMISAVNTFAKNTLKDANVGIISEIRLQKGILLTEMCYSPVNVFLIASKASPDLKNSIHTFADEFTLAFKKNLYGEIGDAIEIQPYDIATVFTKDIIDPIVKKNFSNVPDFITQ